MIFFFVWQESRYCILFPGVREGHPDFMDMLMTVSGNTAIYNIIICGTYVVYYMHICIATLSLQGCIPVLTYINRDYVLPFSDLIDWTRLTVTWLSHDLEGVVLELERYKKAVELEMRKQIFTHYDRYFASIATITMATLDVINRRVFPLAKLSEVCVYI